jgi:PKD repeat protein
LIINDQTINFLIMKNYSTSILLLMLIGILMGGCKKTDPPVADFIYTIDVLTVTFENLTTGADSYAWDFGDGNTSAEKDPVHIYTDGGTYTVSLVATNEGGSSTHTEDFTLTKPAAIIDGNFSDWADYTAIYSDPDGDNGTLLELKMTHDAAFLYLYVKADASVGPILQFFIDKDNNGATGWDYWGAYETPGVEYLMEWVVAGDDAGMGTLFSADQEDWPWNTTVAENAVTTSSGYVTEGSNIMIEFSMARSLMPDLGTTIRISVDNMDSEWSIIGSLPWIWQDPPTALATFTFD